MLQIKDKKFLIIGASGQVGQSFRRYFGEDSRAVFTERSPKDNKTKRLDITDLSAIRKLVLDLRPDVLINCAAYTAVDLAEKETDQAMHINGAAVEAMAKASSECGAVFIHYSTDYVFDGSGSKPWLESDATSPVNAYGKSKLAGEQAVLNYAAKGYVFRTQWVYDNTGKNFLNTMLRLASDREELGVVCDQIGAPTSSDVISEFTLKALEKIVAGTMTPGIYHLTCRGEISWQGFAEKIFELARAMGVALKVNNVKKIETKDYPTPARRPLNSRLSLEKLEHALGERLPEWDVALRDVIHQRL